MTYTAIFAMPVGQCTSHWELEICGATLSGTITDPENSDRVLPINNGSFRDGEFQFDVKSETAYYEIQGQMTEGGAEFSFALHEEKNLQPGKKLFGNPNVVSGEYYVGFHSAGGPRYNNVVLEEHPDHTVTGEMFSLVTEESLREMQEMRKHMPPGGPGGPGGPPGAGGPPGPGGPNEPGGPRPEPKLGDKQDLNVFTDGYANGNHFFVHTETAMNSVFDLNGTVEGTSVYIRQGIISHFRGHATAE